MTLIVMMSHHILPSVLGFAPRAVTQPPPPTNKLSFSSSKDLFGRVPHTSTTIVGYAASSTHIMLMLEEAVREMAVARAKEKLKEMAKEKVKEMKKEKVTEVVIEAKEAVKDGIKDKIKKRLRRSILGKIRDFLVKKIMAKAIEELQERRSGIDMKLLDVVGLSLSNSSIAVLEGLNDPNLNLFLAFIPNTIISANKEPETNKDIDIYDENGGEQKFSLGWKSTGEGYDQQWKKKLIPAISIELAEDLSVKRIRKDAFTGATPLHEVGILELSKSSVLYPLEDKIAFFNNEAEANQLINDVKLQSIKHDGANPNTYNDWGDQTTDEHLSRFFFHGLGAVLLEQQTGPSTKAELGPIEINMDFMADLAVREGFRPYGATLYFDEDQKVTGIYDTHKEILVKPGDEDAWERAKFLAKSSALALITAREHLLDTHLTGSNYLSFSSIKHLPPNHPIRRLMNIFTYNANRVNDNAMSILVPENGLFHRFTAFEYESMVKVFKTGFATSNIFEPFPKRNMRPELLELSKGDKLPYHKEGCEYYDIVEKFVREWLKEDGDSAKDEFARAFYSEIRDASMGSKYELPEFEKEDAMVDLLSQGIFTVTAFHEIVGTTIDYTSDPWAMAMRVVDDEAGSTAADVQSFMLFLLVTATTGKKVPMLMKPYSNYFGKDGAPKWERKHWKNFMRDLRTQSFRIRRKECGIIRRKPEFKFFDPKRFESSVSV